MQTRPPHNSPEHELLLACGRFFLNPDIPPGGGKCGSDSGQANRLASQVAEIADWDNFLNLAREHGMLPLACHSLSRACSELVPGVAMGRLRQAFRRNARANLVLLAELLETLDMFASNGIQAVPLRGPVLALSVYADLALRPSSDLDVLVHRKDMGRACALLMARGYRPADGLSLSQSCRGPCRTSGRIGLTGQASYNSLGNVDFVGAQPRLRDDFCKRLCRKANHLHLVRRRGAKPIGLELHWNLLPPYLTPAGVDDHDWKCESFAVAGMTIRNPAPEDMLLMLCLHGAKHVWDRLIWICDVAGSIRAGRIDWARADEEAEKLGCRRMLRLGLLLARDFLEVNAPQEALARAEGDRKAGFLAARISRRFRGRVGALRNKVEEDRLRLTMVERSADRVRYVTAVSRAYVRQVLTPNANDYALFHLPAGLSFCRYLLKPFRLLGSYVFAPLARRMETPLAQTGETAASHRAAAKDNVQYTTLNSQCSSPPRPDPATARRRCL